MKINNKILILTTITFACLGIGLFQILKIQNNSSGDDALLSIIKNDQKAFESYIEKGGSLQLELPLIDGNRLTVAEGIVYFERVSFMKYLHDKNKKFVIQKNNGEEDVLSMAIAKNNPEIMDLILKESPDPERLYGDKKWTLLHIASAKCSHKVVSIIQRTGKLNWHAKSQDGFTPITLAAEKDCLPILSYLKGEKIDFKKRDGRGISALEILKGKKDMALAAFAQSFDKTRKPASVIVATLPVEPDFYRKREIPKEKISKDSDLIDPEMRPDDANETADYSEFSD